MKERSWRDNINFILSITMELTTEVLLKGLEERYTSIRTVRDRVQSITLWIL